MPVFSIRGTFSIRRKGLWFMVLITIVTGAYKPTYITGGPHIVSMDTCINFTNPSN